MKLFLCESIDPGDTRGPAEEARGRSLAALEKGDRVKMSDFMGRGFASLFVGWIGLQSALQVRVRDANGMSAVDVACACVALFGVDCARRSTDGLAPVVGGAKNSSGTTVSSQISL